MKLNERHLNTLINTLLLLGIAIANLLLYAANQELAERKVRDSTRDLERRQILENTRKNATSRDLPRKTEAFKNGKNQNQK